MYIVHYKNLLSSPRQGAIIDHEYNNTQMIGSPLWHNTSISSTKTIILTTEKLWILVRLVKATQNDVCKDVWDHIESIVGVHTQIENNWFALMIEPSRDPHVKNNYHGR